MKDDAAFIFILERAKIGHALKQMEKQEWSGAH